MVLLTIIFLIYILRKKTINEDHKVKNILIISTIVFIGILMVYWYFLENVYDWQCGIAGRDMLRFFNSAKFIHEGNYDAIKMYYVFDSKGIDLGYKFYLYFVYALLYLPTLFSIRINLFLVYISQILIALIAGVNIYKYYNLEIRQKLYKQKDKDWIVLFIFVINCAIVFTAIRLLRDIFIVYFLTELLIISDDPKYKRHNLFRGIILVSILAIIRNYTILISAPLLILHYNKKIALRISIAFFVSVTLLPVIFKYLPLEYLNAWFLEYSNGLKFNLDYILKWILSPDYISQFGKMFFGPINLYDNHEGGNFTLIYLAIAIWNTIFIPFGIVGIIRLIKKDVALTFINIFAICNITLFYSFVYSGVSEPRHKLMIIIPQVILATLGYEELKKRNINIFALSGIMLFFIIGAAYCSNY